MSGGHGREVRPLTYAGRARRYLTRRGIAYDERQMSIHRLTPAQRRRALRKERRSWRRAAANRQET